MNNIRSKIFSGVLFLLIIIIVLSAAAVIFINQLAKSSRGTITDNYRTINYTTRMLTSLEDMYNAYSDLDKTKYGVTDSLIPGFNNAKEIFESNLQDESANITEKGELELVSKLRTAYTSFLHRIDLRGNDPGIPRTEIKNSYEETRKIIMEIYSLNMSSILAKNSDMEDKAREIIIYAVIAGGISVVITLLFILTFPYRVVKPLEDRDAAKTKLLSNVSHENEDPHLFYKSDAKTSGRSADR